MSDSFSYFAGVLASYFLRVMAAYAVCWMLSRLSPSPRRRFRVWLFFLLGSATYWVFTLFPAPVQVSAGAALQSLPVHPARLAGHNLLLPATWAPALALIGSIMAAAYVIGVLLFLGGMVWQHLSLRRALRHAVEPSPELISLFEPMRRGFGLHRCEVQILPQLSSPATAGWLRPRILLPELCEQFSDSSELADVLYHELVHVARRDYLWSEVSDLVRCVLFFHPAVWRARQQMRVQRELACDVAVVSSRPEHRADYAQSLTRFARLRMLQPGKSMGIDFAASASILGMRVRAVLSQQHRTSWWRAGLRSALSLALVVSFGLLWPVFGIAAEFAPQVVRLTEPVPPAVAPAPPVRHMRVSAKRRAVTPRQVASRPTYTVMMPPLPTQPSPTATLESSSQLGSQSDELSQPEERPISDNGDPTWTETLPLPRSHVSVANVVQRVATGLAQIGRQEMGREGHDRNGRW